MASYRPFQKLHPLTLLAQLSSRQANGCLQVSNGSTSWLLYLEQGKLLYATNSINPFERLDRHLRRLSAQIPSLVSAVRVQVRLLFETQVENSSGLPADYQAICWLVEQQHLQSNQTSLLIEALAVEVIESFLAVQDGSHELVPPEQLGEMPKFCQLDLRFLVEQCQTRQRQSSRVSPKPPIEQPFNANQINANQTSQQNGMGFKPTESDVEPEPAPESTSAPSTPSIASQNPARPQFTVPSLLNSPGKTHYTIACIDDSPTVLQAIRSFLDDKSFTVLMIDNPVKALMQIVRSKPDLILLDVTMPNLDGYELCSLLRKHPNFRYTPVIMVTGNTGFIDRARAKLVGASGYLTKPFTQSDLVKMVFKHLT
jgi:twitching motility two-component system response regulator PilG